MEIETYINTEPNKTVKKFLYEKYFKGVKSINTLKSYLQNIMKIFMILDYKKKDLKLLNNPIKIEELLLAGNYKQSTLKSIFTALNVAIKNDSGNDVNKESRDAIYKLMMKYSKANEAEIKESKSKKELVSWESLGVIVDVIKEEISQAKTETERGKLQIYLLIALLYTKQPPVRLEYANMKVVNTLPKITKSSPNFAVLSNEPYFYFHKFKNVSKMGAVKVPINDNDEVVNQIKVVQGLGKTGNMIPLLNSDKPMTQNRLGQAIKAMFNKYAGLNYTVDNIRHIYETSLIGSPEYSKMSFKQKEERHRMLLHDFTTAQKAYNKITDTGVKTVSYNDKESIKKILERFGYELIE